MALVIETGSGSNPAANSYADVDDLRTYAEARGVTLPADDADCEPLMIRAMDYLESLRCRYKGAIAHPEYPQPLQWPRQGAYGISFPDALFPSDQIPRELIYAQLSLAIEAQTNDLQPNHLVGASGPVIKERVEGLEVAYAAPKQQQYTSAFAKADALLAPLLKNQGLFLIRA